MMMPSKRLLPSTKMPTLHLHDELAQSNERVSAQTKYGAVVGGRALNGSAVFLGMLAMVVTVCC